MNNPVSFSHNEREKKNITICVFLFLYKNLSKDQKQQTTIHNATRLSLVERHQPIAMQESFLPLHHHHLTLVSVENKTRAQRMSSSIYEIFHYIPPTVHQCSATNFGTNGSNTSAFFLPLQQQQTPFLPCQLHNITDNYTNQVQLVDSNYLMRAPTHFDCYVLLFFARWCQFSVRFAPFFNAIPRAFPGLDFVAYDVSKSLR